MMRAKIIERANVKTKFWAGVKLRKSSTVSVAKRTALLARHAMATAARYPGRRAVASGAKRRHSQKTAPATPPTAIAAPMMRGAVATVRE